MSFSDTANAKKYASIAETAAAQAKLYAAELEAAPDYAEQAAASAAAAASSAQAAVSAEGVVNNLAISASESATDAAASAAEAGNAAAAAIGQCLRVPEGESVDILPAQADRLNTFLTFDASGNAALLDKGEVPVLDSEGKIPVSMIPAVAISEIFVVNSQAAMLALDVQVGDIAKRTDIGLSFALAAEPASSLSNWIQLNDDVLAQLGLSTGATEVGAVDDSSNPTTVQGALNLKASIASLAGKVSTTALASSTGASLIGVQPQGTLAEMQCYVTPEQFGAVGDGVSNDTAPINACMAWAASNGYAVIGRVGAIYGVGAVVHPLGLKKVNSLHFKCIAAGTDAVYRSEFVNGHSDVLIQDVTIDINSNASKGIIVHGFNNCTIDRCHVYGFSGLIDSYGIRLGTPELTLFSRKNTISNNLVEMPVDPYGGSGSYGLNGIALMGQSTSPYGGIDTGGVVIWPGNVYIVDTEIFGNVVTDGTHNITGAAVFRANIHHNYLSGAAHRNINLSGNCQRNIVDSNFLLEAGSSGVNMAWGNRWNIVSNNYIHSTSSASLATDDAAIQMYKGIENITVSGNIVIGDWKYSVYIGSAVQGVNVVNNQLLAGSLSNIAIESDWAGTTLPPLAIYSERRDPNAVPVLASCNDIKINGNTLAGVGCAYYICTFNGKALTGVQVLNETVMNVTSRPHVIYVYDSAVNMSDVDFVDIKARSVSTSQIFSDRGRSPFGKISNVTLMDGPSEVSTSSSTPSAMFGPKMFITGSPSVTNFVNGQLGQTIELRLDVGTTLVHSTSTLRLKNNANVTSTSANQLLTITQRATGVWFEISRNF